jgi:3-isopropylmalate dehydrogenase
MTETLLLLPGDGIGPEVTAVSRRVLEMLINRRTLDLRIIQSVFGGAAIDQSGVPLPAATLAATLPVAGAYGAIQFGGGQPPRR